MRRITAAAFLVYDYRIEYIGLVVYPGSAPYSSLPRQHLFSPIKSAWKEIMIICTQQLCLWTLAAYLTLLLSPRVQDVWGERFGAE